MPLTTALSSRGQLVLPKKLRDELDLAEGTQFIVFRDQDNILLKPIREPRVSDFKSVLEKSAAWAAEIGMREDDIPEAVREVRKNRRK